MPKQLKIEFEIAIKTAVISTVEENSELQVLWVRGKYLKSNIMVMDCLLK